MTKVFLGAVLLFSLSVGVLSQSAPKAFADPSPAPTPPPSTPVITMPAKPDPATSGGKCSDVNNCDLIQNYINPFINLLAALVGVAVTMSIVIGGIQYSNSGGDPQAIAAAKARIRNAIIALLTFFFLYALLNFLVPGGLL